MREPRKPCEEMSEDELCAELAAVRDELGDIEATFSFNLANTPGHQPEGLVEDHEAELEACRAAVASICEVIRLRGYECG